MIHEKNAKRFCRDSLSKIENYEKAIADTTETWDIHHRLELTLDGEFAHTTEELKRLGMYYHRPYFELIFLTHSEHTRLHNKQRKGDNNYFYGNHHSEETRKKMSDAQKGENHPLYGKHHSEETRKKMSDANKGENNPMYGKHRTFTEEHKRKLSEATKARLARQRFDENLTV